jgi:hypothetical protein
VGMRFSETPTAVESSQFSVPWGDGPYFKKRFCAHTARCNMVKRSRKPRTAQLLVGSMSAFDVPHGMEQDFPFFLDSTGHRESASLEAERTSADETISNTSSLGQSSNSLRSFSA